SKENKTTDETKAPTNNSASDTVTKLGKPTGMHYEILRDSSKLEWIAKKVTGEEHGTVTIAKGEVYINNGILTGGNFAIDMSTIKALGKDDAESENSQLTNHLKSDDFFAVEKFPIGRFAFTSATPMTDDKGNNYLIKGLLMVKNIQNTIAFPAKVDVVSGKVTASAELVIDRTKWDIKFRSGKFFQDLGDKLIYDDFTIKIFFIAR
ncbi:MAG: YceI family protein, partial [Ignavibacteria bacterium]